MDDFVAVNKIYSDFFGNHKPARSAVQVAKLPLAALFEIEAIARYVVHLTTSQANDTNDMVLCLR